MMADYGPPRPDWQPPPADLVIDDLAERLRQLEDRVRWIEAQVAVDRARREREADFG